MTTASRPGGRLAADQKRRMRAFTLVLALMAAGIALAAVAWFWWQLPWLAVVLLGLSLPLRWVAMLIADANPRARPDRDGERARLHRPWG